MLAALLAASVTVVTLDFRQGSGGPLRKVQDQVLSVLAPLQSGVSHALSPVGQVFRSIGSIPHLQSENTNLKRQLSALQAQQNQVPDMQRQLAQASGLVGRVTSVESSSSKVLLAIDPQHHVGARLTSSGDTGVLSGNGQADLAFDLIGVTTTVAPGETVVTSGYDGGIYPPGIPIGRVKTVRRSPDGLNQSASVQPFVDFNKLQLVLILLDTRPAKLPGQ